MSRDLTFALKKICPPPVAPTGHVLTAQTVSAGGEGLFLFTGDDPARVAPAAGQTDIGSFAKPNPTDFKSFKLFVVSDDTTAVHVIRAMDLTFPSMELFPDGRILLATRRCQWRGPDDYDCNGLVYDPQTGATTRILLGDAIEDIAIDRNGRIWVSYFDEGVYGDGGPGAGGLVCFDDSGNLLWQFNRQDGERWIDDCYAMNATREEIWIYYYSDFDVCRIRPDFDRTFFHPDNIAGSRAFAVTDRGFLFTSQYKEPTEQMYLAIREGTTVRVRRSVKVEMPDAEPIPESTFIGRGSTIHVLNEQGWFAGDMETLLSQVD